MSAIHNQLYNQLLATVIMNHFDVLCEGAHSVDNGETVPPGVFEPWMRTEVQSWKIVADDGTVMLAIRFRAGPEDEPFQETTYTCSQKFPGDLVVAHTQVSNEYKLCEIFQHIMHMLAEKLADQAGVPSCCCQDNLGLDHDHSVEDFAELVEEPTIPDNVVRLKPSLRVVKDEREPQS